MNKILLTGALLTLSLLGPVEAGTPLHLTLPEAFRIALQNSTDAATSRSKIRQAQWQEEQARSGGLPQLEFDVSYTRIEPPLSINFGGTSFTIIDENNYKYGPALRQAIATFGRLHWSVLAAQLNVMSVRNDYRRVADMVLMQVGTAYDQALQAKQNVSIAAANVGLKEAHLADTQKMLAAGTVARFDLIRNQSDVNLARQQLISAQNNYSKAVAGLLTLLGLDPSQPVVLDEGAAPPPPPTDKAAGAQAAQERRPELQTLNYSWRAAQANAHYYKSTLNPQVSLQANYTEQNVTPFTSNNQFTGTLALQVPILDGGQARAQANQAMEQAEQLRQQYEATRRAVLLDVENGWDDLQSSWQRLALAEQNVRDTEQLAHIAEVRYRGGISTNLERLDAENNLVQVQSAAASARYDYLQAQVRWMQATGQDYPAEVVDSLIMPNREENTALPKGMRPKDADHVLETHPPAHPPAPVPPPVPPSVQSAPVPAP